MTPQITFKENSRYLLEQGASEDRLFNRTILVCTYVEDNTAYFKLSGDNESLGSDYKVDIKTGKMFKWSSRYCSWDTLEGYELTAYGSNDAVGQTGYECYRVI